MGHRRLLLALVLSATWPIAARAQAPAGAEFQVNTYTTSNQYQPALASDASGNFVVVWQSYGQDGSSSGVFRQRFSPGGAPQGSEFRVNSYTTGSQYYPTIAPDAIGNFVVAWGGRGADDAQGVFGQRFNASGVAQGSEFRVNSYTTGSQSHPAIASAASGNFVVVWQSYGQDGDNDGVFGRRFDATGAPQGSEFRVNSYTTSYQYNPAISSEANGSFVVVWSSYGQDGSGSGIVGRRFDAAGVPQGSEFRVNSYTTGPQGRPALASDPSGALVVVWASDGDGDSTGVFGRAYDATGTPVGSQFRVNSYTTGQQDFPAVAADGAGSFVVVWQSYGQDGSSYGIFGRHFDAAGNARGAEFRVNSFTAYEQRRPAVGSDANGDFVVAWESSPNPAGSGTDVFGQRYGDLIFKDGFESGDLSRWSSSATDGGDLSVSGAAAMAATGFGLQAVVNDINGIFVQDDTPSSENRYRARFYFDPNGFDPGEASSHLRTRIFIAFDALNQRAITLVLKRQGGAYSVEGRVRLTDGTRADTGFFGISNGPHFFEFDWRRSSAPLAHDGTFSLWIDDGLMSNLSGLDNALSSVEFVRLGAFSIKTGASGTLYYDQFESRRQTYIGPE